MGHFSLYMYFSSIVHLIWVYMFAQDCLSKYTDQIKSLQKSSWIHHCMFSCREKKKINIFCLKNAPGGTKGICTRLQSPTLFPTFFSYQCCSLNCHKSSKHARQVEQLHGGLCTMKSSDMFRTSEFCARAHNLLKSAKFF